MQKTDSIITFETTFREDYGYSITFKRGAGIIRLIRNGFVYSRQILVKAEIK